MKLIYFLYALMAILTINTASSLTVEKGVVFESENNVYLLVNTTAVFNDDISVINGDIILEDVNLSLSPTSGFLNLSINQWTSTKEHVIKAIGEDQNIDFKITIGSIGGILIYNDMWYSSSFTALSTYQLFDWRTQYNLTLNFFDEKNHERMIGTNIRVNLISDVFGENYTTNTGLLEITGLNSDDYIIQYYADDYTIRNYYFDYTEGVDTNLTLFLINSTDSTSTTITVYDTLGNTIEGARIKVSEYFTQSNSYELVEIAESNFQGQAIVSLNLDSSFYRFLVEYEGEQVYTAGPTIIYSANVNFYIDLTDRSVDDMFDQFGLSGTLYYDNITQRMIYTWNDETNTASKACLYVYKMLQAGPSYQGMTCTNTPSGTAYYNFVPVTGSTYFFKGYITRGGTDYLVVTNTQSFKASLPDIQGGLFYMFIIMVAFSALFLWDPIIAIIAIGAIPLFFTIMGLSPLGYGIVVPVFFLCIVVGVVIGVNRK